LWSNPEEAQGLFQRRKQAADRVEPKALRTAPGMAHIYVDKTTRQVSGPFTPAQVSITSLGVN
jgi:hypothetical protein